MKKLVCLLLVTTALFSCKKDEKSTENGSTTNVETTEKIISLNGAITEVLVNLGEEKNIVGVDVTSNYPKSIETTAKDLGHVRSITIESIMALQPTVLFASDKDLNPELMEKLQASKIKVELVHQEFSANGTAKMIEQVAKTLNKSNYQPMIDAINSKLKEVVALDPQPKVLFIYARGAGNLMVGGEGTPLDAMIRMAGGENAAQGITDFKPLTPEALISSNPDVILMFESGLQSIGGIDGLLKIDGIAKTKAGMNKKVIAMEGQYLSGFGPRLGNAVVDLNQALTK